MTSDLQNLQQFMSDFSKSQINSQLSPNDRIDDSLIGNKLGKKNYVDHSADMVDDDCEHSNVDSSDASDAVLYQAPKKRKRKPTTSSAKQNYTKTKNTKNIVDGEMSMEEEEEENEDDGFESDIDEIDGKKRKKAKNKDNQDVAVSKKQPAPPPDPFIKKKIVRADIDEGLRQYMSISSIIRDRSLKPPPNAIDLDDFESSCEEDEKKECPLTYEAPSKFIDPHFSCFLCDFKNVSSVDDADEVNLYSNLLMKYNYYFSTYKPAKAARFVHVWYKSNIYKLAKAQGRNDIPLMKTKHFLYHRQRHNDRAAEIWLQDQLTQSDAIKDEFADSIFYGVNTDGENLVKMHDKQAFASWKSSMLMSLQIAKTRPEQLNLRQSTQESGIHSITSYTSRPISTQVVTKFRPQTSNPKK